MSRKRKPNRGNPANKARRVTIDDPLLKAKIEFYDRFDWKRFHQRARQFKTLDLSDPTLDVVAEVRDVVRGNDPEGSVFPFSWDSYITGQLWRARKISRDKGLLGYTVGDLWEPPSILARQGRLNRSGESLLYTCSDPWTALREARVEGEGTGFILIKYVITRELPLLRLGAPNPDTQLSPGHQAVEAAISQFVLDVIRTPAGDHGPDTYRFTYNLLNEFYPLNSGREIGWQYESTRVPGDMNIALPGARAREVLEPRGLVVGRVDYDESLTNFGVQFLDWTDTVEPIPPYGNIPFETFKKINPGPKQTPLDLLPN